MHGILLACCFAMPAQKLIPLFQAGNSSLTLTALSISAPDEKHSQIHRQSADRKSELEVESNSRDDLPDEPEVESAAEDSPDDFPEIPDKKLSATALPKPQNQKIPIDADARTKGVSGILAESTGIRPYYPLGARLRGEEGVVKVKVCVNANGCALNCDVVKSSGFMTLDDAALAAVKRARFVTASGTAPAKDSKTVLTFRFDLVD